MASLSWRTLLAFPSPYACESENAVRLLIARRLGSGAGGSACPFRLLEHSTSGAVLCRLCDDNSRILYIESIVVREAPSRRVGPLLPTTRRHRNNSSSHSTIGGSTHSSYTNNNSNSNTNDSNTHVYYRESVVTITRHWRRFDEAMQDRTSENNKNKRWKTQVDFNLDYYILSTLHTAAHFLRSISQYSHSSSSQLQHITTTTTTTTTKNNNRSGVSTTTTRGANPNNNNIHHHHNNISNSKNDHLPPPVRYGGRVPRAVGRNGGSITTGVCVGGLLLGAVPYGTVEYLSLSPCSSNTPTDMTTAQAVEAARCQAKVFAMMATLTASLAPHPAATCELALGDVPAGELRHRLTYDYDPRNGSTDNKSNNLKHNNSDVMRNTHVRASIIDVENSPGFVLVLTPVIESTTTAAPCHTSRQGSLCKETELEGMNSNKNIDDQNRFDSNNNVPFYSNDSSASTSAPPLPIALVYLTMNSIIRGTAAMCGVPPPTHYVDAYGQRRLTDTGAAPRPPPGALPWLRQLIESYYFAALVWQTHQQVLQGLLRANISHTNHHHASSNLSNNTSSSSNTVAFGHTPNSGSSAAHELSTFLPLPIENSNNAAPQFPLTSESTMTQHTNSSDNTTTAGQSSAACPAVPLLLELFSRCCVYYETVDVSFLRTVWCETKKQQQQQQQQRQQSTDTDNNYIELEDGALLQCVMGLLGKLTALVPLSNRLEDAVGRSTFLVNVPAQHSGGHGQQQHLSQQRTHGIPDDGGVSDGSDASGEGEVLPPVDPRLVPMLLRILVIIEEDDDKDNASRHVRWLLRPAGNGSTTLPVPDHTKSDINTNDNDLAPPRVRRMYLRLCFYTFPLKLLDFARNGYDLPHSVLKCVTAWLPAVERPTPLTTADGSATFSTALSASVPNRSTDTLSSHFFSESAMGLEACTRGPEMVSGPAPMTMANGAAAMNSSLLSLSPQQHRPHDGTELSSATNTNTTTTATATATTTTGVPPHHNTSTVPPTPSPRQHSQSQDESMQRRFQLAFPSQAYSTHNLPSACTDVSSAIAQQLLAECARVALTLAHHLLGRHPTLPRAAQRLFGVIARPALEARPFAMPSLPMSCDDIFVAPHVGGHPDSSSSLIGSSSGSGGGSMAQQRVDSMVRSDGLPLIPLGHLCYGACQRLSSHAIVWAYFELSPNTNELRTQRCTTTMSSTSTTIPPPATNTGATTPSNANMIKAGSVQQEGSGSASRDVHHASGEVIQTLQSGIADVIRHLSVARQLQNMAVCKEAAPYEAVIPRDWGAQLVGVAGMRDTTPSSGNTNSTSPSARGRASGGGNGHHSHEHHTPLQRQTPKGQEVLNIPVHPHLQPQRVLRTLYNNVHVRITDRVGCVLVVDEEDSNMWHFARMILVPVGTSASPDAFPPQITVPKPLTAATLRTPLGGGSYTSIDGNNNDISSNSINVDNKQRYRLVVHLYPSVRVPSVSCFIREVHDIYRRTAIQNLTAKIVKSQYPDTVLDEDFALLKGCELCSGPSEHVLASMKEHIPMGNKDALLRAIHRYSCNMHLSEFYILSPFSYVDNENNEIRATHVYHPALDRVLLVSCVTVVNMAERTLRYTLYSSAPLVGKDERATLCPELVAHCVENMLLEVQYVGFCGGGEETGLDGVQTEQQTEAPLPTILYEEAVSCCRNSLSTAAALRKKNVPCGAGPGMVRDRTVRSALLQQQYISPRSPLSRAVLGRYLDSVAGVLQPLDPVVLCVPVPEGAAAAPSVLAAPPIWSDFSWTALERLQEAGWSEAAEFYFICNVEVLASPAQAQQSVLSTPYLGSSPCYPYLSKSNSHHPTAHMMQTLTDSLGVIPCSTTLQSPTGSSNYQQQPPTTTTSSSNSSHPSTPPIAAMSTTTAPAVPSVASAALAAATAASDILAAATTATSALLSGLPPSVSNSSHEINNNSNNSNGNVTGAMSGRSFSLAQQQFMAFQQQQQQQQHQGPRSPLPPVRVYTGRNTTVAAHPKTAPTPFNAGPLLQPMAPTRWRLIARVTMAHGLEVAADNLRDCEPLINVLAEVTSTAHRSAQMLRHVLQVSLGVRMPRVVSHSPFHTQRSLASACCGDISEATEAPLDVAAETTHRRMSRVRVSPCLAAEQPSLHTVVAEATMNAQLGMPPTAAATAAVVAATAPTAPTTAAHQRLSFGSFYFFRRGNKQQQQTHQVDASGGGVLSPSSSHNNLAAMSAATTTPVSPNPIPSTATTAMNTAMTPTSSSSTNFNTNNNTGDAKNTNTAAVFTCGPQERDHMLRLLLRAVVYGLTNRGAMINYCFQVDTVLKVLHDDTPRLAKRYYDHFGPTPKATPGVQQPSLRPAEVLRRACHYALNALTAAHFIVAAPSTDGRLFPPSYAVCNSYGGGETVREVLAVAPEYQAYVPHDAFVPQHYHRHLARVHMLLEGQAVRNRVHRLIRGLQELWDRRREPTIANIMTKTIAQLMNLMRLYYGTRVPDFTLRSETQTVTPEMLRQFENRRVGTNEWGAALAPFVAENLNEVLCHITSQYARMHTIVVDPRDVPLEEHSLESRLLNRCGVVPIPGGSNNNECATFTPPLTYCLLPIRWVLAEMSGVEYDDKDITGGLFILEIGFNYVNYALDLYMVRDQYSPSPEECATAAARFKQCFMFGSVLYDRTITRLFDRILYSNNIGSGNTNSGINNGGYSSHFYSAQQQYLLSQQLLLASQQGADPQQLLLLHQQQQHSFSPHLQSQQQQRQLREALANLFKYYPTAPSQCHNALKAYNMTGLLTPIQRRSAADNAIYIPRIITNKSDKSNNGTSNSNEDGEMVKFIIPPSHAPQLCVAGRHYRYVGVLVWRQQRPSSGGSNHNRKSNTSPNKTTTATESTNDKMTLYILTVTSEKNSGPAGNNYYTNYHSSSSPESRTPQQQFQQQLQLRSCSPHTMTSTPSPTAGDNNSSNMQHFARGGRPCPPNDAMSYLLAQVRNVDEPTIVVGLWAKLFMNGIVYRGNNDSITSSGAMWCLPSSATLVAARPAATSNNSNSNYYYLSTTATMSELLGVEWDATLAADVATLRCYTTNVRHTDTLLVEALAAATVGEGEEESSRSSGTHLSGSQPRLVWLAVSAPNSSNNTLTPTLAQHEHSTSSPHPSLLLSPPQQCTVPAINCYVRLTVVEALCYHLCRPGGVGERLFAGKYVTHLVEHAPPLPRATSNNHATVLITIAPIPSSSNEVSDATGVNNNAQHAPFIVVIEMQRPEAPCARRVTDICLWRRGTSHCNSDNSTAGNTTQERKTNGDNDNDDNVDVSKSTIGELSEEERDCLEAAHCFVTSVMWVGLTASSPP